jgi:hypothetical protein
MRRKHPVFAIACGLSLLAGEAAAQAAAAQQKVTGPQARYWLSAHTISGFSGQGLAGNDPMAMMRAMAGGADSARKFLRLDLGGSRDATPAQATHQIPAGMAMGASLPLLGPERVPPAEPAERDIPEWQGSAEKPKGRMLFFWGCGDSVGPGQPVVLDLAKIADGQLPPDMRSAINLRSARSGPMAGRDRGYAEWPNRRDNTAVPANASLQGSHVLQGNFIPEIRFQVSAAHDFMEPLRLSKAKQAAGSERLSWNRPASALAYFASAIGFKEGAGAQDIVMWNSSAARLIGGEHIHGFLPPAETERLVRERVLLAATATECSVPKEALAAAGGNLVMVNLSAFGPELNIVHPPRPQDPKVDWNQEYAVKLRLRASTGLLAGMEEARSGRPEPSANAEVQPQQTAETKPDPKAEVKDAVKGVLRGIFGR